LLLLIAALIGAVGQTIGGYSHGGLLVSIAIGFIGAMLGSWIARRIGLPESVRDPDRSRGVPVLWSVIGATAVRGGGRSVDATDAGDDVGGRHCVGGAEPPPEPVRAAPLYAEQRRSLAALGVRTGPPDRDARGRRSGAAASRSAVRQGSVGPAAGIVLPASLHGQARGFLARLTRRWTHTNATSPQCRPSDGPAGFRLRVH